MLAYTGELRSAAGVHDADILDFILEAGSDGAAGYVQLRWALCTLIEVRA